MQREQDYLLSNANRFEDTDAYELLKRFNKHETSTFAWWPVTKLKQATNWPTRKQEKNYRDKGLIFQKS